MIEDRHTQSLHSLTRRTTLFTALLPFIAIQLFMLGIYFTSYLVLTEKTEDLHVHHVEQTLDEVAWREVAHMQEVMNTINDVGQVVRSQMTESLAEDHSVPDTPMRSLVHGLSGNLDINGVSVVYPSATANNRLRNEARRLSVIDGRLKESVLTSRMVSAAVFVSVDNVIRHYPAAADPEAVTRSSFDGNSINFATIAGPQMNPGHGSIWTQPYVEPIDGIWVTTLVMPIIVDGEFQGALGFVVPLARFISHSQQVSVMPWRNSSLLVDNSGRIVHVRDDLGIFSDGVNPMGMPAIDGMRTRLAKALPEFASRGMSDGVVRFRRNGVDHIAATHSIPGTGWQFTLLSTRTVLLEQLQVLRRELWMLGAATAIAMLFLGIGYAVYLTYRSKMLANTLSEPVSAIVHATQNIGEPVNVAKPGVKELDDLASNFNAMVATLNEQSERIRGLNANLERTVQVELDRNREKDMILVQQSRRAVMTDTLENISNQWRQPLDALGLIVTDLRQASEYDELDKSYIEQSTAEAYDLIRSMSKTIDRFKEFFSVDDEPYPYKFHEAVQQSLSLAEGTLSRYGITYDLDIRDEITLYGHKKELASVLLQIMGISKDMLVKNGTTKPTMRLKVFRVHDAAVLTCTDNAGGIPPELLDAMFDPRSVSEADEAGLHHLHLSRLAIEQAFGGNITAKNVEGGTQYRIEL